MSRSTLLLLVAVPAVFVVACGSDTTSGTTGTGGSEATTTSATGTGGSAATSSSSSASGSTGTGMMMGACTNPADLAVAQMKEVKKITQDCGKANIGNDANTKACIKMGTGLSDPCVTCYGDTVSCVISNCFQPCSGDASSQACTDCRATKCDPAFKACSGLSVN